MSPPKLTQIPADVQSFFRNQPVLITGGEGFLGKHVVDLLRNRLHASVYEVRHAEYDLTDWDDAREATRGKDSTWSYYCEREDEYQGNISVHSIVILLYKYT